MAKCLLINTLYRCNRHDCNVHAPESLQVLKDHKRGLPISDMLREIVNRGLRDFNGNKNPLGQV